MKIDQKLRSYNYLFTINPWSVQDLGVLALLRRKVRQENKRGGTSFKVDVFGRLGKNNANAGKYRSHRAARRISLDDAARWDVYMRSA
jgi:hypothetical protein